MEELPGQREGTKKYYYDGYFYHSDPRYTDINDQRSYVCTYRYTNFRCPVTAREGVNREVVVSAEHGHSRTSIEEYLRFEEFKSQLKQKARESNASPDSIIKALEIEYEDVVHLITNASALAHIRRERMKHRPKLPANLSELGDLLANSESAQGIYQGQVVISGSSSAVVFASDAMLQRLNDCEEIYVDSNAKCVPKGTGSKQLIILHMRKMGVGIASAFILCSNRTTELYTGIWNFILDRVPGLKKSLKFIMMDLERALVKSVRNSMPWVSIKSCWFHYIRAISAHWQQLGLKNVSSSLVQDILRLSWHLPLLPAEEFPAAVDFYRQKAEQVELEHRNAVNWFIDHLVNQWLPIADVVCLWRSPHRTNKICEKFHGRIPQRLGCQPNLDAFIGKLAGIISEVEGIWENLERGNTRRIKSHVDSAINSQQTELYFRHINVGEFLMRINTNRKIKSFTEFKMYSSYNVKDFNPEESVSSEELMDLLGNPLHPQTIELTNAMGTKEQDIMQEIDLLVNQEELIVSENERGAIPVESQDMQDVWMILQDETGKTFAVLQEPEAMHMPKEPAIMQEELIEQKVKKSCRKRQAQPAPEPTSRKLRNTLDPSSQTALEKAKKPKSSRGRAKVKQK